MSQENSTDGTNTPDGQTNHSEEIPHTQIPDGIEKPQTVKYETYDKAMASLAKEKARAKELEQKLNDIREKEMIEQGKYQELLQEREAELKRLKEDVLKERTDRFVAEAKSIMTDVAVRMGAHDSDLIYRSINLKEVTDTEGKISRELVEKKVTDMKQKQSFLFKSQASRVVDGTPTMGTQPQTSVGKMDVKQLEALYRQKALQK